MHGVLTTRSRRTTGRSNFARSGPSQRIDRLDAFGAMVLDAVHGAADAPELQLIVEAPPEQRLCRAGRGLRVKPGVIGRDFEDDRLAVVPA